MFAPLYPAMHPAAGAAMRLALPRTAASLWSVGGRAALLAALVNAGFLLLAVADEILPPAVLWRADVGLTLVAVLVASVAGALAGTALFRQLLVRVADPMRAFVALTVATLLLSTTAPLSIAALDGMQNLVRLTMHVVVAGFTVRGLDGWMEEQATAARPR